MHPDIVFVSSEERKMGGRSWTDCVASLKVSRDSANDDMMKLLTSLPALSWYELADLPMGDQILRLVHLEMPSANRAVLVQSEEPEAVEVKIGWLPTLVIRYDDAGYRMALTLANLFGQLAQDIEAVKGE